MHRRHRLSLVWPFLSMLILLVLTTAACGSTTTTGGSTSPAALTKVSIGLGYIPDIQFAPFYVAQSKGYYRDAGLDVTFHHGIVNDLIGSMVLGHDTFVFASGDEELVARSKGLKVVDVATVFQKYPVSLIVPANSPIQTLADLKGHTIGEPGPLGSTHVGLLALLYNGIISTEDTLHNQPQLVQRFVQATLKGLKYVIANPADAVQISKSYIPGMDPARAMSVLEATIPLWQSANGQPGYNDKATWQAMEQFLVTQNIIPSGEDFSQAYTNLNAS